MKRESMLTKNFQQLPPVPAHVQAVIDLVIQGMDLLAEGKEWSSEAFGTADAAARDTRDTGAAGRAATSFADHRVRRRQRDTLLRLIKEAPIGIPQEDN